MKNLILVYLFLIYLFTTSAQDFTPVWGPVYKADGGLFGNFHLLGIDGDHYYVVEGNRKKSSLVEYDLNHNLVSKKELNLEYDKKKISVEGILETQKGKFGFVNAFDSKKKEWSFFAFPFVNGDFQEPREAFKHNFNVQYSLTLFGVSSSTNNDINELALSHDSSKVVFANFLSSKDKNAFDQVAVSVFDHEMNLLWSKIQEFPYADKHLVIKQTAVSNDGKAYVIGRVEDKFKINEPKLDYSYKIFRISEDSYDEWTIDLGSDLGVSEAGIYSSIGGNDFIVCGFYTDNVKRSGYQGVFFVKGNNEMGLEDPKIHGFEKSILEELTREKDIEKGKGISGDYDINLFVSLGNEGIGFLAEYLFTSQEQKFRDGEWHTEWRFHSDNIVYPRFNLNGDLLDLKIIKKEYSSLSELTTGYNYALTDDQLFLVFNDKKSRSDDPKGKTRWTYTDLIILDNKTGDIDFKETIFNSKDIELDFVPYLSEFDKNIMLLGCRSAKKYSFATLRLK